MSDRYLVISDLQICFEHKNALKFAKDVKKEFKIKDDCVLNVGDEVDQYWGSQWDKSIEALHTANQEFDETILKLREWYKAFPKMRLAISNHGVRWQKKAFNSGILSRLMIKYQEAIQAPKGWTWEKRILVKTRYPFVVEHGDNYGGMFPHISAAMTNGLSTVIGHHHTKAGVHHIVSSGTILRDIKLWGAVAGCLINPDAYAFEYAKDHKYKPCLGLVVVIDNGATPIWIPMPT